MERLRRFARRSPWRPDYGCLRAFDRCRPSIRLGIADGLPVFGGGDLRLSPVASRMDWRWFAALLSETAGDIGGLRRRLAGIWRNVLSASPERLRRRTRCGHGFDIVNEFELGEAQPPMERSRVPIRKPL